MEFKVAFDLLYSKKATIYIDPIAATPHPPGSTNMKLLHLDSSILAENSASRELSAAIAARWQQEVAGIEIIYRDLAGTHALPHLSGASLAKADAVEAARAQRALDEFLAADVVVIGVPMYNFGIPSQLKAWIDRVAVAGQTFRYTEAGPVGLAGGKKVIVAGAYGGPYPLAEGNNFIEPYLRHVFGFFGIDDVSFITAEGLAISPEMRSKAMAEAHARIGEALELAA